MLRLLLVGLALVLRNVYVWLHWEVLARPRPGYRAVDLSQLPLRALLHWLEHEVEQSLGLATQRSASRPPPTELGQATAPL